MKRRVTAADVNTNKVTDIFVELLDNEMYHAGYEVTGTGTFPDVQLTVTCREQESDKMPNITFEVHEYEKGNYEVIPTLTFPDLTVEDGDFYDTIHYWLDKWEGVGSIISEINKFTFCPENYLEEE